MTPNQWRNNNGVPGSQLEMPNAYNRADGLNIRPPQTVTIIGVGGVGSWVAYYLAIAGCRDMVLIDPDTLEEHNLGRTPFKSWGVDQLKVEALAELIYETRPYVNLTLYPKRFEDLAPNEKQIALNCDDVLDCRDSVEIIPGVHCPITGGYDGTGVTIHVAPNYDNIWGDGEVRYRVTPSYFGAPAMIALLVVNYLCLERHCRGGRLPELTFDFDMKKLVRKLAGKRRYQAEKAQAEKKPMKEEEENVVTDEHPNMLQRATVFSIYDQDPEVFSFGDDDDEEVSSDDLNEGTDAGEEPERFEEPDIGDPFYEDEDDDDQDDTVWEPVFVGGGTGTTTRTT